MRVEFVEKVMRELLHDGIVRRTDSLLAVCAGSEERDFFTRLGFTDVTISNLDSRIKGSEFEPLKWSYQDAQNLRFPDESFDFAFVSDGLHHCTSPHRALLEMYRVSRKGIIMFEGRDSMLMRLTNKLGLVSEFELEAVVDNEYRFGGINNTEIPNFIYRWTERELKKTLQSANPIGKHAFRFYYGLSLPYQTSAMRKNSIKLTIVRVAAPLLSVSAKVIRQFNNLFAMVATKPNVPADLWPWIQFHNGHPRFNREYAERLFRPSRRDNR